MKNLELIHAESLIDIAKSALPNYLAVEMIELLKLAKKVVNSSYDNQERAIDDLYEFLS